MNDASGVAHVVAPYAVSQTGTNHVQIATWAADTRENVFDVARPSLINLPIALATTQRL